MSKESFIKAYCTPACPGSKEELQRKAKGKNAEAHYFIE